MLEKSTFARNFFVERSLSGRMRSASRDHIGHHADAAGFFHLFAGRRGRVLDTGETQAEFVGICRAAESFVELDKT